MVRISHDNKGSAAGWFLDDVTVDIPSRGDHVVFPCHRWLADDEDDGKIERELYPGQQTHSNPSNYCYYVYLRNVFILLKMHVCSVLVIFVFVSP